MQSTLDGEKMQDNGRSTSSGLDHGLHPSTKCRGSYNPGANFPPLVFNSIARAGAHNAGGYIHPFLPPIHPGIRVGDAVQIPIPRPPPPSVPPKCSFVAFQPIHMAILHLLLIVMCLCLFANNLYL